MTKRVIVRGALVYRVALLPFALIAGCGRSSRATSPVPPITLPSAATEPISACVVERETGYATGEPALDAVQAHFRTVLEENRKEFQGRTGRVQGFGAGAIYPQIWLRDSATLIPGLRYFYPRELLTSWLEEHLSHQRASGELWDWIAPGDPASFVTNAPRAGLVFGTAGTSISADKNTTASDQESSAVDAARSVFSLTGDLEWLRKPIVGVPLVDRLGAALAYVRRERFDERLGLVTGAFTADWGDVSPTHADQKAIYLDDETPIVVGLYANALFVRAAEGLAEMYQAVGELSKAREWRDTAEQVRMGVNRHLWQEARGFYRIHRVVVARGLTDAFDDSDVFALGGNALAALYGVADDRQAALVFAAAESRQRQYGLSSVASVILPPYPNGFFLHPIMREPYSYQNGGQWDWWSGRLLLAMFRRGHSDAARARLVEIARRIADAGGLYEWYTRDGRGQGSDRYAGNVGALGAAIYQGLFGLDSRAEGLAVTVRLGAASGEVRACEPALGRRVLYDYRYEPQDRRARLGLESNAPGIGRLALRVPDGETVVAVLLDDHPVAFDEETSGEDRYVSLDTTWTSHRLEVRLR